MTEEGTTTITEGGEKPARPEWVSVSTDPKARYLGACPGCGVQRMVRKERTGSMCVTCRDSMFSSERRRSRVLEPRQRQKLYSVYNKMRGRCGQIGRVNHSKKYYEDRGIRVCDEWMEDFNKFEAWALANGYEQGKQIDRIDNDLGYDPSNCRFVSALENNRNRRCVKLSPEAASIIRARVASGELQRLIAEDFGISQVAVSRIKRGLMWSEA